MFFQNSPGIVLALSTSTPGSVKAQLRAGFSLSFFLGSVTVTVQDMQFSGGRFKLSGFSLGSPGSVEVFRVQFKLSMSS